MRRLARILSFPIDLVVTSLLWVYFLFGVLIVGGPLYLTSLVLRRNREARVQRTTSRFYRLFFGLLGVLAPRVKLRVSDEVRSLRGAVVVCNHASYLDPLLMEAVFPRHSTIVKPIFFRVPIFGWLLDTAGYLGPTAEGDAERMLTRVEQLRVLLAEGGVLFVFPEGTRTRDGSLGEFKPGAFKLARLLRAPVEQVLIERSAEVFAPGRALFRTTARVEITLTRLAGIDAEEIRGARPRELAARSREIFVEALAGSVSAPGSPHEPQP